MRNLLYIILKTFRLQAGIKNFLSFLTISFLLIQTLKSQPAVQNQLILQLKPESSIYGFIDRFNQNNSKNINLLFREKLSNEFNIYLLESKAAPTVSELLTEEIYKYPEVLSVQQNHRLSFRETYPNDTGFSKQWSLYNDGSQGGTYRADINVVKAWDKTTGGTTALGDTIVIAIIDDGIDTSHPDLKENLWINYHEIPGNQHDDDTNGYIDDYYGWNTFSYDDDVYYDAVHGTEVSGVAGARGNNELGISGVAWNVKILMVVGGGYESDAIKAYSYVYAMRKLYNKSNGKKGAYIVATNTSWGLDQKWPKDAPVWCALYDSMGAIGIVSVAATTNSNINVDTLGDLPTTCPSKYLLTVTSTDKNDQKVLGAGYGKNNIDIGCPGKAIYTTGKLISFPDGYTYNSGTSFASPHAAGALALLYASACSGFLKIGLNHPDSLALLMKSFILQGVKPLGSLYNITVTNGRLDVFNAITKMEDFCAYIGMNENAKETNLKVYPTFSNDKIRIESSSSQKISVQITDFYGKILIHREITENIGTIDISSFPEGIYILTMWNENLRKSIKIVKI